MPAPAGHVKPRRFRACAGGLSVEPGANGRFQPGGIERGGEAPRLRIRLVEVPLGGGPGAVHAPRDVNNLMAEDPGEHPRLARLPGDCREQHEHRLRKHRRRIALGSSGSAAPGGITRRAIVPGLARPEHGEAVKPGFVDHLKPRACAGDAADDRIGHVGRGGERGGESPDAGERCFGHT